MKRPCSAIRWFGGKQRLAPKILPLMPPCRAYVECFGGAGSVLLSRPPAPVEVFNDIDGELVNFFQVLADPVLFGRFYRRVILLPYSRRLFYEARDALATRDPVERAVRFYVVNNQGFAGGGKTDQSWGFTLGESRHGMAAQNSTWLYRLESLPRFHARLQRVQVECQDWRRCLAAYDGPETLFYLDPPYDLAGRLLKRYRYDFAAADHLKLVDALLQVRGMVLLSGYRNPEYERLEAAGWKRKDWRLHCHAIGRTGAARTTGTGGLAPLGRRAYRTDSVWRNPACLAAVALARRSPTEVAT
jgi:DNA adenine methylase